jgi:hypothetical protein
MDDATFLKQCGIEVDARWLMESTQKENSAEIHNYTQSLMRISDMLAQGEIHVKRSRE